MILMLKSHNMNKKSQKPENKVDGKKLAEDFKNLEFFLTQAEIRIKLIEERTESLSAFLKVIREKMKQSSDQSQV